MSYLQNLNHHLAGFVSYQSVVAADAGVAAVPPLFNRSLPDQGSLVEAMAGRHGTAAVPRIVLGVIFSTGLVPEFWSDTGYGLMRRLQMT